MAKLKIDSKAPDFTLLDQDGKQHKLSDYKGNWVLVYFYPKDNTPGCTKEACSIRDEFPRFNKKKVIVFGISADSIKSHKKFAENYNLPFILLSDGGKKTIKKYGVWGKKKMMGREYMGILRTSFLINSRGEIKKVYKNVKPDLHAKDILEDLSRLDPPHSG